MDNETRDILQQILGGQQEISQRLSGVETKIDGLETRMTGLETRMTNVEMKLDKLESDVNEIKENAIITRHSVNLLLHWAEKTDQIVEVGLYKQG